MQKLPDFCQNQKEKNHNRSNKIFAVLAFLKVWLARGLQGWNSGFKTK